MYRSRYGVPSLSYADKFNSILNFFLPKEKVEEIRGKDGKADREVNRRLQRPLFPPFYGAFRRRLVLRGWGGGLLWRDNVDKGWGKRGLFACRYIPRDSLTSLITPVRKNLQGSTCRCWLLRPFHTAGRPLLPPPRGIPWQVFLRLCTCHSLPVERRLK